MAEPVKNLPKLPTSTKEAADQSWALLAVKSFVQTAVLWCLFLWAAPLIIAKLEEQVIGWKLPPANSAMCWAAFWLFGCTGFYCGMSFVRYGKGTPLPLESTRRFVVLGPYRFVRNPMALLGIGQGVCVGLLLRSPAATLFSLAGAVAWHLFARPWEESDLRQRFGADYEDYCHRIHNWIPTLTPYPRTIRSHEKDSSLP